MTVRSAPGIRDLAEGGIRPHSRAVESPVVPVVPLDDFAWRVLNLASKRVKKGVTREDFFREIRGVAYDELEQTILEHENQGWVSVQWLADTRFVVSITQSGSAEAKGEAERRLKLIEERARPVSGPIWGSSPRREAVAGAASDRVPRPPRHKATRRERREAGRRRSAQDNGPPKDNDPPHTPEVEIDSSRRGGRSHHPVPDRATSLPDPQGAPPEGARPGRKTRFFAGVILALSVIAFVGFLIRGLHSTLFLFATTAVGSAVFLWIHRVRADRRRSLSLLGSTLFFLFTGFSVLVLEPGSYGRSVVYNALVAASAAMIAVRIGGLEPGRGIPATLAHILVLAANLFGSNQIVFPFGIGGSDAPTHIDALVQPILRTGHVPGTVPCGFGFDYEAFPAHHLLAVAGALLGGLDPARSYYGMALPGALLCVVVVFLIVKRVSNARTGLLAALVLSGSSYFVYWASHAAPLIHAVVPIGFLLYGAVRMSPRIDARFALLSVPFSVSLVFTHPYSSTLFAAVLVGLIVARLTVGGRSRVPWGALVTLLVFLTVLLVHWVYYSCHFTDAGRFASQYFRILSREPELAPPGVYDRLPLFEIFINTLGDSILVCLGVLGLLQVLPRGNTVQRTFLLGPALTVVSLAIIGLVTNLVYFLPNRMYVLLQFLGLAPLAGYALGSLGRPIVPHANRASVPPPQKPVIHLALAVIVASFVFLSTASNVAGFETSAFTGNRPYVKLYVTNSEVDGVDWLCRYVPGPETVRISLSVSAFSVHDLRDCLEPRNGTTNELRITPDGLIEVDRIAPGSMILFSRFDFEPGFQAGITGVGKHGSGVFQRLNHSALSQLSEFSKIYDNGPVEVYRARDGPGIAPEQGGVFP
jgi:hypothetical protein